MDFRGPIISAPIPCDRRAGPMDRARTMMIRDWVTAGVSDVLVEGDAALSVDRDVVEHVAALGAVEEEFDLSGYRSIGGNLGDVVECDRPQPRAPNLVDRLALAHGTVGREVVAVG